MSGGLGCLYCFEDIEPDAEWPLSLSRDEDGSPFHDSCLTAYRLERAEGHLA